MTGEVAEGFNHRHSQRVKENETRRGKKKGRKKEKQREEKRKNNSGKEAGKSFVSVLP